MKITIRNKVNFYPIFIRFYLIRMDGIFRN